MQSLQRREHTLLSARVATPRGKHGRGGLRPARQQLGIVGDLALKKLAHHPKRESAVQLRPTGTQNAQPFSLANLLSGPEKLSLTDTGLALDDKYRTLTAAYTRDQRSHQPQLAITLQKTGTATCPKQNHQGLTLSQKSRAGKPRSRSASPRELAPGAPASPQKLRTEPRELVGQQAQLARGSGPVAARHTRRRISARRA